MCTKMASVSSGRKHTNNSYDLSFKLRGIAVAEESSKSATAREFGVDVRRIREWCSQKEVLKKMSAEGMAKRKRGLMVLDVQ